MDNVIAALEHNDRISELDLFDFPSLQLEKVEAAMQQPFQVLTSLDLAKGSRMKQRWSFLLRSCADRQRRSMPDFDWTSKLASNISE